ncbi:hypothetical protein FMUAM8_00790 [Nocardia cyriacigeorgica]|nr:hypothetical protein FMUAM8_00790 [Nocardia cyriacigeorgica]
MRDRGLAALLNARILAEAGDQLGLGGVHIEPVPAPDQRPGIEKRGRGGDGPILFGSLVQLATLSIDPARMHVSSMVPTPDTTANRLPAPAVRTRALAASGRDRIGCRQTV